MLINILILLFSLLLIYQTFLATTSLIETFDNSSNCDPTNPNNVGILSQQNAANIDALKKQMEQLLPLNGKVQDLSGNVTNLSKQVDTLIKTQQEYAQSVSSIKV
jgi:hypothetical protein